VRASWLDGATAVAALASVLTAAWLLLVVATVLPSRDPSSVPGWTVFALALLAFVALTIADILRGGAGWPMRIAIGLSSVTASLVGGWILVATMTSTTHFEGYLVVVGAVVLVHGLVSLLRTVVGRRPVAIGR
jgi:hypothetical protein